MTRAPFVVDLILGHLDQDFLAHLQGPAPARRTGMYHSRGSSAFLVIRTRYTRPRSIASGSPHPLLLLAVPVGSGGRRSRSGRPRWEARTPAERPRNAQKGIFFAANGDKNGFQARNNAFDPALINIADFGSGLDIFDNRNSFAIEFTDAIEPVRDAQSLIDVQGTTQRITSVIEGWIREHPEQWLWLHRRWRRLTEEGYEAGNAGM